jgi:hypothetical protein
VKKLAAVMVLGLGFVGCATDQGWKTAYENERATRQAQEARIQALENQQPQQQPQRQQQPQQQAPSQQKPAQLTLAQAYQQCQRLDNTQATPINCKTDTLRDGQPVMMFIFTDAQGMQTYWSNLTNALAQPFCDGQNQAGRKAFIIAALIYPQPSQMPWRHVPMIGCPSGCPLIATDRVTPPAGTNLPPHTTA